MCAANRKGGCVSCRMKRCCICWQSKFLIIFFVLLWYSVSEVSSREISWNFMDSWPRVNECLEISSSPLGRGHIGLHVKRKTCLLSAVLERIYCLGKMRCFLSSSLGIQAFLCLLVGTSQANARQLIVFLEAHSFCFEFPVEILGSSTFYLIYSSENLTLCSRPDIFK